MGLRLKTTPWSSFSSIFPCRGTDRGDRYSNCGRVCFLSPRCVAKLHSNATHQVVRIDVVGEGANKSAHFAWNFAGSSDWLQHNKTTVKGDMTMSRIDEGPRGLCRKPTTRLPRKLDTQALDDNLVKPLSHLAEDLCSEHDPEREPSGGRFVEDLRPSVFSF